MKILFIRNEKVYLPEITAYKRYVSTHFPSCQAFDSRDPGSRDIGDFDVIWHFMGLDLRRREKYGDSQVVHEYNSLSTGLFPRAKNMIKKMVNTRPSARVFLNDIVRKSFGFNDGVPFRMRDMGVDKSFFAGSGRVAEPEYDFVYAGSLDRKSAIIPVLERFRTQLSDASILLVGDAPEEMRKHYQFSRNIVFAGRVPYHDVPVITVRARYGINLMPDRYPLNRQTATKVLEYCAMGLPVITSDYHWVRRFEAKTKARFFYIDESLDNLTMKNIGGFDFSVPDVREYEWGRVIEKSGVFDLITGMGGM